MSDVVVFSGSAHPALARRITRHIGVRLSELDIKRFSNDCLQVQLLANCRQRDVYIIQPLVPPTQEHLMELLLMVDAARGASAAQITAVIPHYAYARSDKKDASRISLGGRLVADLLVTAGVDRVLTMALHAPQVHGFFSVPVDHLTAIGVLADHFRDRDLTDCRRRLPRPRQRQDGDPVRPAARPAGRRGQQAAHGRRPRSSSRPSSATSSGKRAIVLDDEIATGGSILELLDKLRGGGLRRGLRRLHPRPVHRQGRRAAARPPDDPRGRHDRHRAAADRLAGAGGPLVAELFAEAITRVHQGESVSKLFDGVDPTHAPPQPRLPFDQFATLPSL